MLWVAIKLWFMRFFKVYCLLVLILIFNSIAASCTNHNLVDTAKQMPTTKKAEMLSSGFIDLMNNGQVSASARLIRLMIGEPGKFSIPISMYSGVSSNNLSSSSYISVRNNEHLINQFITPLSGLLNFSIDGIKFFSKSKQLTKIGFVYQVGDRILTGIRVGALSDPLTGKPYNFLNNFGVGGFYLQTGAWENSNTNNLGFCWLSMRYHYCFTRPSELRIFLPDLKTNGLYTGYSFSFGIDISSLVNMKMIYYRYIKAPELVYSAPIYQFSFTYSVKNY